MVERNACHELGCRANCCQNMRSDYAVGEDWFKKAFPGAIKVGSAEDLEEKIDPREQNIYYYPHSGWIDFVMNGECPNLDEVSYCRIHSERFFPNPCRNMIPNSPDCHEIQKGQSVLRAIVEQSEPVSKGDLLRIVDKVNS